MDNPLRLVLDRVGDRNPLLLAHHPRCEYYDHHTIELYGWKCCLGCFVVYPVGAISLSTLVAVWAVRPESTLVTQSTGVFYTVAGVLIAPMVASKLIPGRRSTTTRLLSKALLAIGLAALAFPAVTRPADRLLTIGLGVGFLVPYVAYKGLTARDDCQGCPEAAAFPNCSGMEFETEDRDRQQ